MDFPLSLVCFDAQCAEDNGGCGPAAYFNCTNNVGIEPVCGAGYPACDTVRFVQNDFVLKMMPLC